MWVGLYVGHTARFHHDILFALQSVLHWPPDWTLEHVYQFLYVTSLGEENAIRSRVKSYITTKIQTVIAHSSSLRIQV
jgi:hypothetical protein